MKNCFLSVITLLSPDLQNENKYMMDLHHMLEVNFSDFEIILINNKTAGDIKAFQSNLAGDVRKDITILNLSSKVHPDSAIVAGLDRSNGDYTVVFDSTLYPTPELIIELYNKTQENYDIVYLKFKQRKIPFKKLIFYKAYYYLLEKFSEVKVDINMHQSRIVSRRALNSVLKIRENLRYMKGIYSFVGYRTSYIEVNMPEIDTSHTFSSQFKSAIISLLSFTELINKILLWVFLSALAFSLYIIADSLMIKIWGIDLFGTIQNHTIPGWTFLLITISIMFDFLTFILYILSIYLSGIFNEIKNRPLYFIESVQRI